MRSWRIGKLARWLGPWADSMRAPDVPRHDDAVYENEAGGEGSSRSIRVRLYGSSDALPYLVAPGLHYAGPDDPRMDRFCRVLAAAGHLVIAPFVESYLRLVPDRAAIADFEAVFRARARWTTRKPAVFSISFGSLLALALAAHHSDELDGLTLFGGYASFPETMKFCLTGERRDPLNQSVVLINLLPVMPQLSEQDRLDVAAGWRRFVEATWGRPELKDPARYVPIAESLAPDVPERVRELFLIGVGARPGAAGVAMDGLTRYDAEPLDPTPYLAKVRGRVDLVHGTDDDVIHFQQSHALARGLVNAEVRVHVTGMYGHTGAARPTLRAAAREAVTMARILGLLAR